MGSLPGTRRVTKQVASRTHLEGWAKEGDSPVGESESCLWIDHLSTTWKVSHVGN
jgi:hypothetical protein